MKMFKIACGEQIMIMTTASEWLSKFISKTDKKLDRVKELVLRNSRITVCEVLTCWDFYLCQVREFQRAMRT